MNREPRHSAATAPSSHEDKLQSRLPIPDSTRQINCKADYGFDSAQTINCKADYVEGRCTASISGMLSNTLSGVRAGLTFSEKLRRSTKKLRSKMMDSGDCESM